MTLLARLPLPQALAMLANGYLEEAMAAAGRLDDAADEEALHDTRVALRRLHSLIRAFRAQFDAEVPRTQRKAVRALARASNPARDAEVQQAWLMRQGHDLTPAQQEGYRWLLARLQPAALLEIEDALREGVGHLAGKLRRHFNHLSADGDAAPYGVVSAELAAALIDEVCAALAAIGGAEDACGAHKARILVKRLRYLLTPLHNDGPACELAVGVLRRLQDLLGELHDRHVLDALLRNSVADAAAEHARHLFDTAPTQPAAWRAPQIAGLLVLAARNRAVMVDCHDELQRTYLGQHQDTKVCQPLRAAVAELHAS